MKSVRFTSIFVLILGALSQLAAAQEPPKNTTGPDVEQSATARTAMNTELERFTGRLPRFFASLVDEVQRGKIYAVQRAYRPRIAELESQLAALKQAEQAEIHGLLTPAQLERLEALRAESMVRRAGSKPSATRPAESAPVASDGPQADVLPASATVDR